MEWRTLEKLRKTVNVDLERAVICVNRTQMTLIRLIDTDHRLFDDRLDTNVIGDDPPDQCHLRSSISSQSDPDDDVLSRE